MPVQELMSGAKAATARTLQAGETVEHANWVKSTCGGIEQEKRDYKAADENNSKPEVQFRALLPHRTAGTGNIGQTLHSLTAWV